MMPSPRIKPGVTLVGDECPHNYAIPPPQYGLNNRVEWLVHWSILAMEIVSISWTPFLIHFSITMISLCIRKSNHTIKYLRHSRYKQFFMVCFFQEKQYFQCKIVTAKSYEHYLSSNKKCLNRLFFFFRPFSLLFKSVYDPQYSDQMHEFLV